MMKKLMIVSIITLCFSFSISKSKKFIPPGTVQITNNLFADETEISNLSWLEYEFWVKTKYGSSSEEYKAALPDTNVFINEGLNLNYMFYHQHISNHNYPVIGVSYEQAQAFCKWRTERVKDFLVIEKRYNDLNFEYRLPSKKEWEALSNNGSEVFNTKNEIKILKSKKGEQSYQLLYKANCMMNDTINTYAQTREVYAYQKNVFGLYNMIGNVSEMVLEKGISKGGSWKHRLEECRTGKDILYNNAAYWIGFRCVCEIK